MPDDPLAPPGDAPAASLARHVSVVTALTFASRLLGLLRDYALVAFFTRARWVSDAFIFAFRIPNLFRNLLGEGALTASFLPVFVREREHGERRADGGARAVEFACQAASLLAAAAGGLCAVVTLVLLAVWLWLPPGPTALTTLLTAVMFPFMAFICLAALLASMLQALKRFALPAALSIVLNLAFLAGFAWIYFVSLKGDLARMAEPGMAPEAALALAWAVLASGAAQTALAWGRLRQLGIALAPRLRFDHPGVKDTLRAFVPTALGLGIVQINVFVDGVIALWLSWSDGGEGAQTYLYAGAHLMQLPLALFGASVATTAFPYLSAHAARNEHAPLMGRLTESLKLSWTFTLPAAAILIALADPIARLLFQRTDLAFSHVAVYRTALTASFYALGIGFFAAQMVLVRVFYARGDYAAPVRIAARCAVVNLVLNLILVHCPDFYRLWLDPAYSAWNQNAPYAVRWGVAPEAFPFGGRALGEAGLALATTLTAALQCGLLWMRLRRGFRPALGAAAWDREAGELAKSGLRLALAAAGAGVLAFWFRDSIPYEPEWTQQALRAGIPLVLGILAYAAIGMVFAVPEIESLLRRRRGGGKE